MIIDNDPMIFCVPTPKSRSVPRVDVSWNDHHTISSECFGPVSFLTPSNVYSSVRQHSPRYSDSTFDGVCVDTGAQISVCGPRQALAYCRAVNIPFVLRPSQMSFKFGDFITPSKGLLKFRLPCPDGVSLDMDIDVVDLDVPLLLGLRELRHHKILVDYLSNTMENRYLGWKVKLNDKFGHLYWDLSQSESCYSRFEIERLHKHFFHPSARKLYDLLKRSELVQATPNLKKMVDDVSLACAQCREFSQRPFRFRASLPDDSIVYNHELALDLMWLDGRPVLHVVDCHTSFQNAIFVSDKTPEGLWRAFTECWSTVYLGLPNVLRIYQEASFNSEKFMALADSHGVILQFSGVESHNSIGKGERYHPPLRRVFDLLCRNNPNMKKELLLRYAIKGVGYTANMDGLVPSLLVFGVVPSFPMTEKPLPNQRARLQAIVDARLEMGRIVTEQRITRALRSKLPPAVTHDIRVGQESLVYREKKKRWVGPYTVSRIEDKRAFISDGKSTRPFNLSKLLPHTADKVDLELFRILKDLSELQSSPSINITEVFYPSDPRAQTPECRAAIKMEVDGILSRGVFRKVKKTDIPRDANVITTRMVLSVKDIGTSDEKYKARVAAHGHKDRDKHDRVHNSPSVRPISLRLLLTSASIRRYRIWATDIVQAFIQAFDPAREIYIIPPREFGLREDEVFLLIKPLYGLVDAGDYWYITL